MARKTQTPEQKAHTMANRMIKRYAKLMKQYAANECDFDRLNKCRIKARNLEMNEWIFDETDIHDRVRAISVTFETADKERLTVRRGQRAEKMRRLEEEVREVNKPYEWMHRKY